MSALPRFRRSLFSLCIVLCLLATLIADAQTQLATHTAIQTIYVMPSSHWDLGFIAPPEEVLPKLKPHIDEVIANAKRDPDFRWTIESVWQIREWLARTTDGNNTEVIKTRSRSKISSTSSTKDRFRSPPFSAACTPSSWAPNNSTASPMT